MYRQMHKHKVLRNVSTDARATGTVECMADAQARSTIVDRQMRTYYRICRRMRGL